MREVVHQYGVELDWMEDMAAKLEGFVADNQIKVPAHILSGIRYACPITDQLTAFVLDVTYHEDILYKLRNEKDDFIGLYFNLTEGDAIHIMDEVARPVGRWACNLAILDCKLNGDYLIRAGSTTYMISVFIKKAMLKEYLRKVPNYAQVTEAIFDQEQNTVVRFDRMSNHAWWLMNELKKTPFGTPVYDLVLKGTVYGLIGDYMEQIINQEILLEKVVVQDMNSIIASQSFLVDQIKTAFPGIAALAAQACMSESKYKRLFKKITGSTANAFFLNNKVAFAKELLETGDYTIAEIADEFHFFDASHLIEQFKSNYGLTPKEYLTLL